LSSIPKTEDKDVLKDSTGGSVYS